MGLIMEKDNDKTIIEKLADKLLYSPPKILEEFALGRSGVQLLQNGEAFYLQDGVRIRNFHSSASVDDGRSVNTRTAKRTKVATEDIVDELGKGKKIISVFIKNGLELTQMITLRENGEIGVQIALHDKEKTTRTRYLAPIDAPYPDASGKRLFLSLDQKMLVVPYDNDMWVRYESAVPCPGRSSYDVTAIFDETSFEGLVIGALDFDVWKNAISWSAYDARALYAYSGVADAVTHDTLPHAAVCGDVVASARFVMMWCDNVKRGLENFGSMCATLHPPRKWSGKTPFGWNSFSALSIGVTVAHWKEAGDFIKNELPEFCDEDGVSFINLDAAFGLGNDKIKKTVDELHKRGQKAGWYCAPMSAPTFIPFVPASGTLTPLSKFFLCDYSGKPLPKIDNFVPLDVTHPLWEKHARNSIKKIVELGFDYIKFDFLSHGAVEGQHYLKNYTGRMALNYAYNIIEDELKKANREIFVSLSISPLFPYFLGNARRCCCDSFGHYDDVRYVLNALNFGWWTNGRLYNFNDPDHLSLYNSVVDGRTPSTLEEARSRYNAGIISGTLMMLSDNYGPSGDSELIANSRQRAKQLANNAALNEVARLNRAFVPVELSDGTSPFYTLSHNNRHFAALFNFSSEERVLSLNAERGGLPTAATAVSLNDGSTVLYVDELSVKLRGFDSVIFEIKE